jgi:hypothetical protein
MLPSNPHFLIFLSPGKGIACFKKGNLPGHSPCNFLIIRPDSLRIPLKGISGGFSLVVVRTPYLERAKLSKFIIYKNFGINKS